LKSAKSISFTRAAGSETGNFKKAGRLTTQRNSDAPAKLIKNKIIGEIKMRFFKFTIGLSVSFLMFIGTASAQLPTQQSFRLQPYVSGLSSPLLVTNAKDGTKRLFIVQQGGIIKVVQPGATTATDFMNITPRVLSGGERGLLGLAFHPQFATNGYFFVNYTRSGDGATIIARFKTTDSTNALGDPNSERILLTIAQPFSNHNGGMIEFRTDGNQHNLYIGMGDGGSANDPGNRAQNINELLGKFLRITPDVSGSSTAPLYTIPNDNPYAGATPGADEIYAIGVRNPFRWSFDRGGTRQLWAGDVGQGAREEVDIITLGGNYGWRIMEGTICTPGVNPNCTPPAGHIPPVLEYSSTGARCSITGGYVYRGTRGALPNGAYIYGDYCTGEILMWHNNQQTLLFDWANNNNLSSFGEDEDGELYVCGLSTGTVSRISRTDAPTDFDGDSRTDFSVFRPSTGIWYILNSFNNSFRAAQFGQNGDTPAPADYDGDNVTDIAVFRSGFFYYLRSSDNAFRGIQWGQSGDVPVAADYDGDGKADVAVFRFGANNQGNPSTYYVLKSSDGSVLVSQFVGCCDAPVPGDYDGDGKADFAVWQAGSGNWRIVNSGNSSVSVVPFGIFANNPPDSDITTPGDFDGDGKTDIAVFRPSTGVWYIRRSSDSSIQAVQFGTNGDFPVVGDYDGDERSDIAVFRPSTGAWYFIRSSNSSFGGVQFGQSGDLPIPAYDNE
jgi:glucose/arabinose dehydrogenase